MKHQRLPLLICAILVPLGLLLTSSMNVRGQAAARPNRCTMPTGSYAVSDIENISLTNGNLNVGIDLASLPPVAGGKLGLTVRATYNSKLWDAVRAEVQTDPLDPSTKYTVSNLQLSNNGGWRVGAGFSITFESIAEINYELGKRLRDAGSVHSWSHIKRFGDMTVLELLRAWCGLVPLFDESIK